MPSEAALLEAGIPLDAAKNADFARGKGCNYCQKKGFRGRNGIHELLIVNSRIRDLIFTAASTQDIRKQAINDGMRTLYVDGIQKAMKGITTLEEVYRVAKRGEQDVIPV
jgi:type IV pilus assembly protein PilB